MVIYFAFNGLLALLVHKCNSVDCRPNKRHKIKKYAQKRKKILKNLEG